MAVSITNDSKNSLSITNDSKPSDLTWADMDWSWDEASGTWAQPEEVLAKDTKNTLTITNDNKN